MASSGSRQGDGQSSQVRAGNDRSVSYSGVADEATPQRRRNDVVESWVEISSQPSSSSLSSIGDEIVTTGLRVGNGTYPPRRRRLQGMHSMPTSYMTRPTGVQAGTSSQEEYEETESEEDHVMTSSNENIGSSGARSIPRQQTAIGPAGVADSDTDDDDDENATALGRPSPSPVFRPQPNAFSHPPSHLAHRHSTDAAIPTHQQPRPHASSRAHSRVHRGPPNFMSPSYQADNDAALRASLTTLLSCAAAARGLPKKDETLAGPSGVRPSAQPLELRLVPESELMAPGQAGPAAPLRQGPPPRTASNSSAPSAPSSTSSREREAVEKTKRSASAAGGSSAKPARATKKKRTSSSAAAVDDAAAAAYISPTLLTWVVSAGVVVLVSVVGFGAGYVIGREVGRQEGVMSLSTGAAGGAANASASCGQELVRSTGTLRRFRWGAVGRSVVA